MKYIRYIILLSFVLIGGCANQVRNYWGYPPMAVPLQPGFEQEAALSRIDDLLAQKNLDQNTKASLYKIRGYYQDSVGLRELARLDYERSLKLNPNQADVLNLLGVYFTQITEYDAAVDAFDASLQLSKEDNFALRNRAIALYYGNRIAPALDDMYEEQKAHPDDPYSAIWVYFMQANQDLALAETTLRQSYETYGQSEESSWSWTLVQMILGDISEKDIFENIASTAQDNTEMAQQLTETYFYLGKMARLRGDYSNAIALFKLTLGLNVYQFSEHHYSFVELGQIFEELKKQGKIAPKQDGIEEQNQAEQADNPDAQPTDASAQ